MSKIFLNKLLSCLLAMAVCSAAVFGCLITVNAESVVGAYSIKVENDGIIESGAASVSVEITFEVESGFTSGNFIIADSGTINGVTASVVGGEPSDGSEFSADHFGTSGIFCNTETDDGLAVFLLDIADDEGNVTEYNSVTIKLTFTFTDGAIADGYMYEVKLVDNADDETDLVFFNRFDNYDECTDFTGSSASFHAHNVTIAADGVAVSDKPEYEVCGTSCSVEGCDAAGTGYQVTTQSGALVSDTSVIAANLVYENNGSFTLNFHYKPNTDDATLYVCKATQNADGTFTYTTVEGTSSQSVYAGNGLDSDTMMYSINIGSAKNIFVDYLATVISADSDYSVTRLTSVEAIAQSVVDGKAAYYDSSITAEQKAQDINVAASLINYGYAVTNVSDEMYQENIEYWDSDIATGFSSTATGEENDPIIINDVEELAYLVRGADGNTAGKFYKMSDDIDIIIAQTQDKAEAIMALNGWKEVKSYFESVGAIDWYRSGTFTNFEGTFDGNGVVIYGLGGTQNFDAKGLFPVVGINATIKNVTVRNSYIYGGNGVGALVGRCGNNATQDSMGNITISNCEVANCYIKGTNTSNSPVHTGTMLGYTNDSSYIVYNFSNILVYGTHAEDAAGTEVGLFGSGHNSAVHSYKNIVTIDSAPYNTAGMVYAAADEDMSNVYTNTTVKSKWYNYCVTEKGWFTDYSNITFFDSSDAMLGTAAAKNMPELDWVNTWCYGSEGNAPSLAKPAAATTKRAYTMPEALETDYAYLKANLDDYNDYGESTEDFGIYATSLNAKANPYIAFTFAFNKGYKTDRNNITVTFTTTDGIDTKTIITTVPEYTGADIIKQDGWTNVANAGRYHLYRLYATATNAAIDVEDMCNGIDVTVSYSGEVAEAKTVTGRFGVEGFALSAYNANKIAPCNYYATRAEVATAMLFYTQMVNVRYANQ